MDTLNIIKISLSLLIKTFFIQLSISRVNIMKIQAAIFDMDGLLFDTERLAIQTWINASSKLDWVMNETLIIKAIGRNKQDTKKIFQNALGMDFPFEEIIEICYKLTDEFIRKNGIPIKDGVFEILSALKSKKLKLSLATSTNTEIAEKNLEIADIGKYFSYVIGSEKVEKGKPEPDIFQFASDKMNISPEKCIVFEDSENGILAAYRAGMRPILIPDIKIPTTEVLEICFKKYNSLIDAEQDLENILY